MTEQLAADIVTAFLVILGSLMCLAAGVGLIRFPDVLSRLHAATKPQIFGLILIVLDVAISNLSVRTVTIAAAILVFQCLTAPMSAHMVARTGYNTEHVRRDVLIVDELAARRRRRRG